MKVKELIEKLSKLNPEAVVVRLHPEEDLAYELTDADEYKVEGRIEAIVTFEND